MSPNDISLIWPPREPDSFPPVSSLLGNDTGVIEMTDELTAVNIFKDRCLSAEFHTADA
jgi:hypothetical protein